MDAYTQTLYLGVIILTGYAIGRIFRRLKMPMVVGYVVAGVVLGPSVANMVTFDLSHALEPVKILGLGMIALVIGGGLEIKKIRHLGKEIAGIAAAQVGVTFLIVFLTMHFILALPPAAALLLGALSTATAPASQVAVIREYGARGRFTNTLMGIVALQNAGCIILFGVVSAAAALLVTGASFSLASIGIPLFEVIKSALLGGVAGLLLTLALPRLLNRNHKVAVLVAVILINSGLAHALGLSPLLANMACGFCVANLYVRPEELSFLEDIEMPVILVFFVMAGASLQLEMLRENWIWAAAYIVVRGIGLLSGTYLGALLSKAERTVRKYVGFSMHSKAGLTIGLLMLVQARFPELAPTIVTIELAAVSVCELFGPLGTRYALISSGDASGKI